MENKKRICFVAQFPPPMHGLSKAVETLFNSSLSDEFELEKVDITNNKKFFQTIASILKSKADLFYFTISQSIAGNIRDLIILKLFQLKKKKVLVHLHGGYYRKLVDNDMKPWQKKANYKAMSKIDGAIVLGSSLKWIFEGMVPSEKIYTVPNCVDDEFLMSDEEFENKLETVKIKKIHHVLWLSNFIRSKGYPVVLEMAKLEKDRVDGGEHKKFHFDFAGEFFDDKEKAYFESYIKENHIEDYITYHGVVGGDKKRELLKKCIFFALPTRYLNEGQPISILEAMGNGMVILTTDHAGIPDIVEDKKNGFICTTHDNMGLYYIKNLINNCFESILIDNRLIVINKYKQESYINNMVSLFKVTLGVYR